MTDTTALRALADDWQQTADNWRHNRGQRGRAKSGYEVLEACAGQLREAIAALAPPAAVYGDTANTFRALSDAEVDEINARLREAMPPIMRQTHPPSADRAAAAPAPEGLSRLVLKWRATFPAASWKSRDDYYAGQACGVLKCSDQLEAALRARPALSDEAQADAIVQAVAELPDRTSPDDWPEAMLVTSEELRRILQPNSRQIRPALSDEVLREMADALLNKSDVVLGLSQPREAMVRLIHDACDLARAVLARQQEQQ